MMKKNIKIIWILLAGFILLQFFRLEKINYGTPAKDLSNVPTEVNHILRNSCFDCHSSEANLKWYDKITPANFLVISHIKEGRQALDFSQWDAWPKPKQNATIYYAVNKILSGEMPIPSYSAVHPSTKLTDQQVQVLKKYAQSLSPRKLTEPSEVNSAEIEYNNWVGGSLKPSDVKPSPNGIQYIPDYRNWKAISTTDRFDNGTMRIIFGNDIAVKAIQDHNTNPWPDGTTFAKTAWKQNVLPDGSITSGAFIQVEFMIKDTQKYSKTKGWGFARFKGDHLKPYGDNADFAKECVECHQPMKKRDYVFTSPLYLISQLQKMKQK